jgi:DNA recombination protein RmuC
VDHVLLFLPNESIFGFVHEHDPTLVDFALGQKVVLCSPFTLFAVLAVIRQAVDAVQLQQTSDDVLRCLGAFGQQWDQFIGAMELVGRRLDTAHRGFEELAGPRRRQLERQLDRLDELRKQRGLDDVEDLTSAQELPEARAG